MSVTLYAQPHDLSATGFYFDTKEEFAAKCGTQPSVSEYGIEFVKGPEFALSIFDAARVGQENLCEFLDAIVELDGDEHQQAAVFYSLSSGITSNISEALEEAQDAGSLFEGNARDYAEDFIQNFNNVGTAAILFQYFDYEAFARDLVLGGDVDEFTFCGKTYVVTQS